MPPKLSLSTPFLNEYVQHFDTKPVGNKLEFQSGRYYNPIDFGPYEEIYDKAAALSGYDDEIDSVLEYALASYFSPAILNIRPVKAAEMLPANSKASAFQLAYATLKELAEVKFLTPQDTAVIGRYEGMVKFIQDKHGLTRAEIDKYFHDAIKAEVTKTVDEAFSKISFLAENAATFPARSHNAVLTRNPQNGHYTLSYSGAYTKNGSQEIKDMPTLDALLAEMRRRTADFDQTGINSVRAQVALMPVVAYAERKAKGEADALDLIAESIADFYVNPSADNYNTLVGISARLFVNSRVGNTADYADTAYNQVLKETWYMLYTRINRQIIENVGRNAPALARYPADKRYDVFSK